MRRAAGWLLMLGAPAVVVTLYEFVSRTTRTYSAATDYIALAVALIAGLGGVWLLVPDRRRRALAIAVYVPLTALALWFTMTLGCRAFGDCPG